MKRRQRGLYTVEFAVVGTVFFLVLFGVMEIARALYVWETITEATRRGARVAAVCPPDDSAIRKVAVLNNPSDPSNASPVLSGLTTANVSVEYLDEDGAAGAVGANIAYVRVSITGFQHNLIIPFLPASVTTLTVPPFSTTLPAESLGYLPDTLSYGCPVPP